MVEKLIADPNRPGWQMKVVLCLLVITLPSVLLADASAEQEQETIDSYLRLVYERIREHQFFPRSGQWARCLLRFALRWDGELVNPAVVKITGSRLLCDAALETLYRAAPFPPFPPEIKRDELYIELPMVYKES